MINEEQLIERDLTRDVWQETLDAVQSIKSGQVGATHHISVEVAPIKSHSETTNYETWYLKPEARQRVARPGL